MTSDLLQYAIEKECGLTLCVGLAMELSTVIIAHNVLCVVALGRAMTIILVTLIRP